MTDQRLILASNGSIQRLLHIATASGWDEVAADARECLRQRSGQRGKIP